MNERGWRVAAVVAVCVALGSLARTVLAETPVPKLPTDCDSGEVVVAREGGRFECESALSALGLRSCSGGDFVSIDSIGRLQCVSPSTTSFGAKGLLPECSSGHMLVSEGFGRWECVEGRR